MGFFRKVEDEIKDVGRKIDDEIFQPVADVGSKIDDEIIQPVKNTVEAIIEDPKKLAAVAIAIAFPGAGAAIGAQLGLFGTVGQVVGQALLNTALNGGDVKSAVISAALPVVGQAGANALSSTLASSGIEGAVNTVITRAVTQGTTAAILGKDPLSAALLGGVTAGVNAIVPDIPGYNDLPAAAKNAISSAIATKLTGGDVGGAVSQSLVNDAIAWAKSEVSKTPNALKAAQAAYKADTGTTLSDDQAAELLSLYGTDGIAAAADRLTTSQQEAREIWKQTVGTEPTEFDLMEIIGLDEGQANSVANRAYNVRQSVFDGEGYASQQDVKDAASAAGYNSYTWNGEQNKTPESTNAKEVEDKKYDLVDQLLRSQGTTIAKASDDELRSAMDAVNEVPTGLLGNATLEDVISGKYSATNSDGTLRIEVTGAGALADSPNADKAAAQLPDGMVLATESDVWGVDGTRNPNVEYAILPDGTAAFVKRADGETLNDFPLRAFDLYGSLDELAANDPEAWLQMASQFDKKADGGLGDYLAQTANSIMLGAYATGNEKLGDSVKQTLSVVTQGVGEQASNLATFFTDRLGMDHDSAIAKAGKALQDWGAANQSKSTKDQEAAIIASVSNAKSVGDKIGAFVTAAKENPGGLMSMIAKEGIQEILPLWAAKAAYRLGSLAAVGANTAIEAIESWGAGTKGTYDEAKRMGFSDDEARMMASKVGLQSAVITTVTNGFGDNPLVKRIIGDAVKDSAMGIAKAGGREAFTEYFDGLGSNAVQQYQLTGTVNWDQATTAATIGAGVGAGTSSGIMLGAAINSNAVIGKGLDGSDVTYADFLSGAKQVDMGTINLSSPVGADADGDSITLGNLVAMPVASGLSYDVVKAGLPAALTNSDVALGTDELGNTVTLSSLMGGVTESKGFDAAYKNLLNITPEQRTEAKYDYVSNLYGDLGYTPTPQEINELIAQNPAVTQIDRSGVESYVDPRIVTEQEVKNAYAELGLTEPTQADIDKLIGQYEQEALAGRAQENLGTAQFNVTTAKQEATTKALADLEAKTTEQYDALTAEQKALADALTAQGTTLSDAIATVQEQTQDLSGLIGTQGRSASQQDIDALNQMVGGQRDMDLAYDVTGDKQITQADIDFLTGVVGGVKTDWTAPQESPWAATGLYGQIQANELRRQQDLAAAEAQRQAEQQAAAERARQESVRGGLRTTALQGQQQLQALQQQLPQAIQMSQTTSTPIYGEMGPYLNLGSPLDFDFFRPSPEKQAATKQAQPTKIAAGGYIDDLLAEGMTVDDLLNLLR